MWGEDSTQSTDDCAQLKSRIASLFPIYQTGVEKFRLKQDRRAMRVYPIDLSYKWQADNLQLNFKLLPGAYATGVMREIIQIYDCMAL
jgi:tRNA pseudouridine13 synthase